MNENEIHTSDTDPALDPTLDHVSRRTFLGRAGSVAALGAVSTVGEAQDKKKVSALDDPLVDKKEVTFPLQNRRWQNGRDERFLAIPIPPPNVRWKPRGAVIVVHEIFGLNPHIRDIAARLAQAGFIALAPDFFTREGTPPKLEGNNFAPVMEFVGKITDAQIMADIKAGTAFLQKREDANRKVGIVGFCWGGRVSMLSTANVPELKAAVAFYGRITGKASENQPKHPLDLASKMTVPLMGHFGEKDGGIPVADVDKLREALKEDKHPAELFVYEGAGHAFNNDTRESYQKEAAALAWKRTLEWFSQHLQA